MNFNKEQKEILELIEKEEICDILSFVRKYKLYEKYKLDKNTIDEEFQKTEGGKQYPVNLYSNPLVFAQEGKEILRGTTLDYSNLWAEIKFDKDIYTYDLLSESGIDLLSDFNQIKGFLALWEYLKKELYVLEIEKNLEEDEAALFLKKIPNADYETYVYNEDYMPIEMPILDLMKGTAIPAKEYEHKVPAKNYIKEVLECDEERLKVCKKYLNKKIIPTPALKNFIEADLKTPDQNFAKNSLRVAIVAIVISIVTFLASIYTTCNIDPSDANLKEIQKELIQINQSLETINLLESEELLRELQEVNENLEKMETSES